MYIYKIIENYFKQKQAARTTRLQKKEKGNLLELDQQTLLLPSALF